MQEKYIPIDYENRLYPVDKNMAKLIQAQDQFNVLLSLTLKEMRNPSPRKKPPFPKYLWNKAMGKINTKWYDFGRWIVGKWWPDLWED